MAPQRMRGLLIGVAMVFLGPSLGLVIYLAMLMHLGTGMISVSPFEALQRLGELPSHMFRALIPLALCLLCGAAGFVVVIANLVFHFFGQQPNPPASSGNPFTGATPPASFSPVQDDSRYMPKQPWPRPNP